MKTTLTVLLIIKLCGLVSCAVKQHYFVNQEKSWDKAKLYCRNFYYELSTFIDETEEKQFLEDAFSQNSSEAWVGLYKEFGLWRWSGGEAATRISWEILEPHNDNCAYLNKTSKKLLDGKCQHYHPFFCMTFEFVVVLQSESWDGALEHCRHHYDDLVSLSSNRRMTDALSKITGAQTQYVWIGLRFLAGEWFWISGDDLEYEVWSPDGQPQCPARNQRCAALDQNRRVWTPRDCEEKLNFLCV